MGFGSAGAGKMKLLTGILVAALLLGGVGPVMQRSALPMIGADQSEFTSISTNTSAPRAKSSLSTDFAQGACTIVLGAIPRDKVCLTSNAKFGFQVAWDFGANGHTMSNSEATQMLYSMYPSEVKHWIAQRGA